MVLRVPAGQNRLGYQRDNADQSYPSSDLEWVYSGHGPTGEGKGWAMATRSAEVKAYVPPDVKAAAMEIYARWGMSLSDAVNAFLVKSVDVGGLPFDMRPAYDPATVLPVDPRFGSSVLPADMDDGEDAIYERLT